MLRQGSGWRAIQSVGVGRGPCRAFASEGGPRSPGQTAISYVYILRSVKDRKGLLYRPCLLANEAEKLAEVGDLPTAGESKGPFVLSYCGSSLRVCSRSCEGILCGA
jgi:hypothetical protein